MENHEWQVISNTWARGIDFCVFKENNKWSTIWPTLGTFRTKTAAYDAITSAVLSESRSRAARQ